MAGMTPAKQPTYARGGDVDDGALAHARGLLDHARRAAGGSVNGYQDGGADPHGEPDASGEAKRLLQLIDRIEKENPNVDSSRQFSYLCQRSPGISKFFRKLLQEGFSRSGARATIYGALGRWADGQ